ncbi:MAG: phenylalanine--tRNA ligase subunit beta [Candidatus Moranbacteria bacterium]|nr:phenylalanine--tRNA ligase subunit beta [Candidatus Moranbacteria bacterium]
MNLLLSYNWIKQYTPTKLSAENFAKTLSLKGPSIEQWHYLKDQKDYSLDIEITSNRVDMASVIGIAREAAAILEKPFQYSQPVQPVKNGQGMQLMLKVPANDLCPRYQAIVLSGLTIKASPQWLQAKIKASGLKPINNIVDITNYVLLEYGQPTHVFDYDKIKGQSIIVRRAKSKERFISLENKKYQLDSKDLVIADQEQIIGLAGIKGGKKAEVDSKTKNIVIESANFNPIAIRQTSRKINLKTEASTLFERSLHPQTTQAALYRIVELVRQICAVKVSSQVLDQVQKSKLKPSYINFNPKLAQQKIGIKIPNKQIVSILTQLGFECQPKKTGNYQVKVPFFRANDVQKDYDLIEEIARIHGYDKVPSELPQGQIPTFTTPEQIVFEDKLKDLLFGLGFTETYSYSMISQAQVNLTAQAQPKPIRLLNPLNDNFEYMRPELASSLLYVLKNNQTLREQLKLFEINQVYKPKSNKKLPKEISYLALLITGASNQSLFYQTKGVIEYLFKYFKLDPLKINNNLNSYPLFNDSTSVRLGYQKKLFGRLGLINETVKEKLSLKKNIGLLEINLEKFHQITKKAKPAFKPIPKYPAIKRDFAFIVDLDQTWESVYQLIKKVSQDLFVDCFLFDSYQGSGIESDKKSIAFTVILQSKKRTLQDQEVDQISNRIIHQMKKQFQAKLRDH